MDPVTTVDPGSSAPASNNVSAAGLARATPRDKAALLRAILPRLVAAAPELVAKSFGLTLAELRVLVTIVQAGGIAETAEALGIAETTVKTHLQRLFSKTGTSRQTDLVKLFVSFSSPLAA